MCSPVNSHFHFPVQIRCCCWRQSEHGSWRVRGAVSVALHIRTVLVVAAAVTPVCSYVSVNLCCCSSSSLLLLVVVVVAVVYRCAWTNKCTRMFLARSWAMVSGGAFNLANKTLAAVFGGRYDCSRREVFFASPPPPRATCADVGATLTLCCNILCLPPPGCSSSLPATRPIRLD